MYTANMWCSTTTARIGSVCGPRASPDPGRSARMSQRARDRLGNSRQSRRADLRVCPGAQSGDSKERHRAVTIRAAGGPYASPPTPGRGQHIALHRAVRHSPRARSGQTKCQTTPPVACSASALSAHPRLAADRHLYRLGVRRALKRHRQDGDHRGARRQAANVAGQLD